VRLPRLLTEDPSVCVPLILASPPRSFPGLSVFEFVGANDPSVVTQEQPLRLTVPRALEANEFVVAVAYDGESFLPAGQVEARRADETVIRIDRLPASAVDGRLAQGAIPVFFEKVISRRLEEEFPLPLLAAAEVGPGGTTRHFGDAAEVRRRIARANHILLFVPGIVGDSQSMVSSVRLAKFPDGRPLVNHYDLVLIFEYDSLNTRTDDAARALKRQIEATGLGPGHRQSIDIVAHSTGGLLARWYIEREGGNRAVRKLIMLGTPNGGWPWPRFDDWAKVVLGLGLNQLTTIVWPASVIGSLMGLIENASVVPAEIRPGGRIIEALQSSHDPGIPYILLAGTASILPPPSESAAFAWESMIKRLITQIASEEVFFNLLNPSRPQQSNDLAVAMMRMDALPAGWKHPCEVRPVDCDHLSYFTSEAGLHALAEALAP
jgi:pimeloyl-ACP methyl ester carboxylesterase